jgi:hypothetical protein
MAHALQDAAGHLDVAGGGDHNGQEIDERRQPGHSEVQEKIAEKLALAVDHDGTERAEIIADVVFATSYCRRLIDATAKQDETPLIDADRPTES